VSVSRSISRRVPIAAAHRRRPVPPDSFTRTNFVSVRLATGPELLRVRTSAVRPGEPAQKPNVRAVVERIVEAMRAAEAEVTMHERIAHALTLDETCESLDPIQRRGATR